MKKLSKLAIVTDLDGTLIHTLPDICAHINRVRADYGLDPRPESELASFIGHGATYLAQHALSEVSEREVPRILERFRSYYLASPHAGGYVYPGVVETLKKLKTEWKAQLAVATNKPSLVAEKTLEFYMPEIPFDVVAGPDRVSKKKPDPAHLLEVLRDLGCSPKDAWYVGDHPVDRECAEAAQVRFLGARYGFGGIEIEPARALDSFAELLDKIKTA